jgi:hypothetical protein
LMRKQMIWATQAMNTARSSFQQHDSEQLLRVQVVQCFSTWWSTHFAPLLFWIDWPRHTLVHFCLENIKDSSLPTT